MTDSPSPVPWRIAISADQLQRLANDERFRDLLQLNRAANAVRFAMTAGTELGDVDTAAAFRQRLASYFFTSAVLEEVLILLERLGRSLRQAPSWNALASIRNAASTRSLRDAVLDRARNQAVFHFDDVVIERGLFLLGAGDTTLADSNTTRLMDVHYNLADRAALAYVLEEFAANADQETVGRLIRASLDLGTEFLNAADAVVREVAAECGLEVEVLPPAS